MIDEAISNNGNKTYLHILSQYRLLVSRYKAVFFLYTKICNSPEI